MATLREIQATVERLGCVQIDTLQMVQRSQYLVLWSRLGNYNPADLDRLAYEPQHRALFEGWQHAACLIPSSTATRFRMHWCASTIQVARSFWLPDGNYQPQ
jgi:uncharacterized protein YcaQ